LHDFIWEIWEPVKKQGQPERGRIRGNRRTCHALAAGARRLILEKKTNREFEE
jgi:hypothetical protein